MFNPWFEPVFIVTSLPETLILPIEVGLQPKRGKGMGGNNCDLVICRKSGGASVDGNGIAGASGGVGNDEIDLSLIVTICFYPKKVRIGGRSDTEKSAESSVTA